MVKLTSKEKEALSCALYDRFDQMGQLVDDGSVSKSEYNALSRAIDKLEEGGII